MCDGAGVSSASGDRWRDAGHHHIISDLATAYLGDRRALEQIDREEVARRLADGDLNLIDVRPAAEYAAGHIARAVSIPIDRLSRQLRALPPGIDVVAYCRGPYCVFADDAVRFLHRRGRSARRLQDGYPEWRDAQLPIEAAQSARLTS